MDVSSIASLSSALSQTKVAEAASTIVLKKSLDIQAQNANQLLQALPQVANNPPNLGNSIDVRA